MNSPITMQDVRLIAGEGKLAAHDVLAAVNAILRRRAEAASPAAGWRPIETAPKDGGWFYAANSENCVRIAWEPPNRFHDAHWTSEYEAGWDEHELPFTHWMPLPASPSEEARAG